MDIQQKLMDISTMMEYIEKHLTAAGEKEQLDEISGMLDKLLKEPSDNAGDVMQGYKDIMEHALEPVLAELKETGAMLGASQETWMDGLSKLNEQIGTNSVSMGNLMEQESNHQGTWKKEFDGINHSLQDIICLVSEQEKKEKKERFAKQFQEQVSDWMELDKKAYETYVENAEKLEGTVKDIQTAYQSLASQVEQASESFTKTAERLEGLLSQMTEGKKKKWGRR